MEGLGVSDGAALLAIDIAGRPFTPVATEGIG
jgi:hypothetical protein